MDEAELIQRAREGEMGAFRELVERNQQRQYYLALDLTGNHHDAEDLSQEAFIKAYQSLHQFRGEAKFSSWLYRITVNLFINMNRKMIRKSMSYQPDMDMQRLKANTESNPDPEMKTEYSLIQQHIEAALKRLSPRERTVFILRHYQDLKLQEIADILGVTTGTVKSTLFRALQRLKNFLAFYQKEYGGKPHETV